jgi:hypothetical protein
MALSFVIGAGVLPDRAAAHEPHAGLDFSINVRGANCGTQAGAPSKCLAELQDTFTLEVRLDSLPPDISEYAAFDLFVTYSGVTSLNNPSAQKWPQCLNEVSNTSNPGEVRWACVPAPGDPSAYTGPIGTLDFNCPAAGGTINLVHGIGDGTALVEPAIVSHAEGQGTMESLTINCIASPSLGGVAEYPDLGSGRDLHGLAAAASILITIVAAGGWFARRRIGS